MRKLVRGAMPGVLAVKLRQKKQQPTLCWEDVTEAEKAEIWEALAQMQGACCAYCERRLEGGKKQHIEHFLKQAGHGKRVFDWHNLFGSCVDQNSCGKHKDERAKNWRGDDLIKPDVDDPDDFLRFYSDGRIRPREGLTPQQQLRAQETLRVFNLDEHDALREMRKRAVSGWLSSLDEVSTDWWGLFEQGECTEEEALAGVEEEVQSLLSQTASAPFATAIRHTLMAQIG